MSVRLTANGIPGFQSDGLAVGRSWSPVEIGDLPPKAREALLKYSGRFVRVHPDDGAKLAEYGLELYKDGETGVERIREIELQPRELAPGEVLSEGAIPPGVTSTPIPAPSPPVQPSAPAPAARGARSGR